MGRTGRPPHPDILTPREWEVLGLLREGLTNEEIGERLGISLDGAKYHVSEILTKLGVRSRKEAAAWATSRGERRPAWAALPLVGLLWRGGRPLPPLLSKVALGLAGAAFVAAFAALGLIAFFLANGDNAEQPASGGPTTATLQPTTVTARLNPSLLRVLPDLTAPNVEWSPDGQAVVLIKEDGFYIARAPEFEAELLVQPAPAPDFVRPYQVPIWSPDGSHLAFAGPRSEGFDGLETVRTVYLTDSAGEGLRDLLPGDRANINENRYGRRVESWLDESSVSFVDLADFGSAPQMAVDIETGEIWEVVPPQFANRPVDAEAYLPPEWQSSEQGGNCDDPSYATMSPDGLTVAIERSYLGDSQIEDACWPDSKCLTFVDVGTGDHVGSMLLSHTGVCADERALGTWIGNDAVTFISGQGDSRVLWLIEDPQQPKRMIWQEDLPPVQVWAQPSPGAEYAVVAVPTSSQYLMGHPGFYEARIFGMR